MLNKIIKWCCGNKLTVFLGLLSFCLLISTIVLSTKKDKGSLTFEETKQENVKVAADNTAKSVKVNYRLPRDVEPRNYKLLLRPHTKNMTFDGLVRITVLVVKPTKRILFHSSTKLDIQYLVLKQGNKIIEQIPKIVPDDRELLYVPIPKEIPKGMYDIEVKFSGRMDKKLVGFYASALKKGGTMVASKFQPTYARQAFPCFDEPDFKATYDITLVKPSSYVALSNMNEVSNAHDDSTNTDTVTFATSVPMSTYLACFVICDFDFKEVTINSNGVGNDFKLRSFAQKGETHKIDFAQDIGKRATEFYINYYQVPFPLPKLDMIAIPDYVSGATEHWGLITYRETSFLVDEATASARNKISVANTIAHELAHMWFGNLVTMKWWDDLWLNEGFATYMQMKALNAIEPSWTMLDQFVTKTLHSVLVLDAKLSSHPIVQTVETPDEITAIFDSISYNKGSSILRMLEGFVGEEKFRKGVSDYLKKFEFGNTVTQDLLSSLDTYFRQDNPDLSLSYIMDTWTKQMGYPLLTVKPSDKPNTYIVTQSRFLLNPKAAYKNDSQFNYRWFIPITYKTNQGAARNLVWFPDKSDSVEITLQKNDTWLKLNNNQVGYYRVNYTADMWNKLVEQLKQKTKELTLSDRAHLLNEVFALAEAHHVSYELALNMTTYLTVEEDYVPWEAASAIFINLDQKLRNSLAFNDLKKFIQQLVRPLYEKQSWEKTNGTVIQGLLRTQLLALATRYALLEAETKVREIFLQWLNSYGTPNVVEIEPDLRDLVYSYGMKSATMADWEKLWKIYLDEQDVQEKLKLQRALSRPSDSNILRRFLTLAWDERNVRSQDYLNVLISLSDNPSGVALVWDSVRSHWPELVERFTLNSRYLGNMVASITSSFDTELKLKEMESFFSEYPEAGAGEQARRRAVETVRNNIEWTTHYEPVVAKWLNSYVSNL